MVKEVTQRVCLPEWSKEQTDEKVFQDAHHLKEEHDYEKMGLYGLWLYV